MSGSAPRPRGRLLSFPPPCPPNPVDAYLARLAPSSARTMKKLLSRIAALISPQLDAVTARWHLLRYPDTLEIRRRLVELYAPATCRLALCALRGVLREAWRLGLVSREEFERAIDLPAVRGSHQRLRPEIDPNRIRQLFLRPAHDTSPRAVRDLAILAVLYGGGLRRAELSALSLGDVRDGALAVCGKGQQYRLVYLPQEAARVPLTLDRDSRPAGWAALYPDPSLRQAHLSVHVNGGSGQDRSQASSRSRPRHPDTA